MVHSIQIDKICLTIIFINLYYVVVYIKHESGFKGILEHFDYKLKLHLSSWMG